MRITAVETYLIETESPVIEWRDGLPASGGRSEDAWLRVCTDEGIDGWCAIELWGRIVADIVGRRLRPLALGADALRREALWSRVWQVDRIEELPIYAMGLLDVALFDIAAKAAELPLWRFLGGCRDRLPAYASTATYGSVEEYLDVADQCLELGFRAIKLHAWGDARRDADLCTRLREHVGDDVVLLYDGSAAFDPYDALVLGRAVEAAGYRWYEEPMREFSLGAYRTLASALDVPVLVTETSDGCHYTAAEFLAAGAADLVRTGWYFKGGITGSLRVAHVAEAFGTTAEVHGGSLPNAHLCCAISNTSYYESIVGNPVLREPCIDATGHLVAPTAPGIGWDVGVDDLRQRAIAVDLE